MSLVQRRRSKSRESKPTFGIVSGVESFWRNTIACSPSSSSSSRQGSSSSSSSSRSSRPVLRVRSQCYSRRVEGDDGAARRLANLAYQGSDGDLSPCLWPASGGGAGEGGGGEGSVRPPSSLREKITPSNAEEAPINVVVDTPESARVAAVAEFSDQSQQQQQQQQQQILSPSNNSARFLFPPLHTHIPCAISTPSRYPGLGGGGGGGPLFRSQSARGRRRTATLSPTKPGRSSPLTAVSSSSQGSVSTNDISMTSVLASPSVGGIVTDSASEDVETVAGGKSYDAALFDILKVSPEDLAAQITLLDIPVFKAIAPEELTSIAWTAKDKLIKAPNLVALTRRFNQINMWVQTEILKTSTVKARGVIMSHFVKVMKKLFDLNNLHSAMAILAALQSAAIFRLSKSWLELGSKDRSNFKRIAQLFSEENNNQRLREHMTSLRLQACIPHMGMYLTDLVYVDVAHPYSGGMESAPRRDAMNNIIRVIADYQASCNMTDKLGPVQQHIQAYLASFRYIEELQKFIEDDYFRLSKRLEPPASAAINASNSESSCQPSPVQFSSPQTKKGLSHQHHHHHHHPLSKAVFSTPEAVKTAAAPNHRKTQSLSKDFNVVRAAAAALAAAEAAAAAASVSSPGDSTSTASSDKSLALGFDPTSKNLIDDSELEELNRTPSTGSGASSRLVVECLSGGDRDDRLSGKRFSVTSSSTTHSAYRRSFEESFDDEPDLYLRATSGDCTPGSDRQTITMSCRTRSSGDTEDDDDEVDSLRIQSEVFLRHVVCEGCLKRKPLLKKGRRPTMQNFTRYWVQLSGSSLIYFAAKFTGVGTLGGSSAFERQAFKSDPCKMQSVLGWMAILGDDPKEPDSFQLTDPNDGNCYKFRAGTRTRALTWCQNLTSAANSDKRKLPENLISLE